MSLKQMKQNFAFEALVSQQLAIGVTFSSVITLIICIRFVLLFILFYVKGFCQGFMLSLLLLPLLSLRRIKGMQLS